MFHVERSPQGSLVRDAGAAGVPTGAKLLLHEPADVRGGGRPQASVHHDQLVDAPPTISLLRLGWLAHQELAAHHQERCSALSGDRRTSEAPCGDEVESGSKPGVTTSDLCPLLDHGDPIIELEPCHRL